MKAFLGFCITIIFVYLVSSCRKQDTLNVADTDSTTLKTFATLIPNQLPLDTFNKFNYSFDANNRLIRIEGFSFYDPVTTFANFFTTQFSYNGSDTLPYRAVVFNGNMRPRDTTSVDSALFFYNNGKLIRDSVVHFVKLSPSPTFIRTGYDAQRYVYNGSSISAVTDNWTFAYGQLKANVMILISQNTPNTITIEKQRTAFSSPVTSKQQYKITYDNNPNPLFGLAAPSAGFGFLSTLNYRYYFPNNVVEIEKIFDSESSTPPWHDKFDYTYRSDGFPLTAVHFDLVNQYMPYYRKGLFFYK